MRKLLIVWWTIWLVFFSAMPVGVVDAAPILEPNPSPVIGGGGVDPTTGQMWVNVTAPNGGPLKGAQMANLLAYFRGKGFQPTSWRPTYDQTRGIWVLVFVTIKATGVPQIVCKWDAASNCLRRVDNWKPCSKQTICTERG